MICPSSDARTCFVAEVYMPTTYTGMTTTVVNSILYLDIDHTGLGFWVLFIDNIDPNSVLTSTLSFNSRNIWRLI